jgi:hypothetical protein
VLPSAEQLLSRVRHTRLLPRKQPDLLRDPGPLLSDKPSPMLFTGYRVSQWTVCHGHRGLLHAAARRANLPTKQQMLSTHTRRTKRKLHRVGQRLLHERRSRWRVPTDCADVLPREPDRPG